GGALRCQRTKHARGSAPGPASCRSITRVRAPQKLAPGSDGRSGTGRGKLVALKLGFSRLCGGLARCFTFGQSTAFGALRQDLRDALHGAPLVELFDGGEFTCHAIKRVLIKLALRVRLFGLSLGAEEI